MAKWQVQEAKARLSEVIDRALAEGPQTITRHGERVAIVISQKDYAELTGSSETLVAVSRKYAGAGDDFELKRLKDRARGITL